MRKYIQHIDGDDQVEKIFLRVCMNLQKKKIKRGKKIRENYF